MPTKRSWLTSALRKALIVSISVHLLLLLYIDTDWLEISSVLTLAPRGAVAVHAPRLHVNLHRQVPAEPPGKLANTNEPQQRVAAQSSPPLSLPHVNKPHVKFQQVKTAHIEPIRQNPKIQNSPKIQIIQQNPQNLQIQQNQQNLNNPEITRNQQILKNQEITHNLKNQPNQTDPTEDKTPQPVVSAQKQPAEKHSAVEQIHQSEHHQPKGPQQDKAQENTPQSVAQYKIALSQQAVAFHQTHAPPPLAAGNNIRIVAEIQLHGALLPTVRLQQNSGNQAWDEYLLSMLETAVAEQRIDGPMQAAKIRFELPINYTMQ